MDNGGGHMYIYLLFFNMIQINLYFAYQSE